MEKALSGVKVIDLTDSVAGPYCTMIMGDLGAEVIKIEQIGEGDVIRRNSPEINGARPVFAAYNRNKKSIALDLKNPKALQIIKQLLAKADVLIDNSPHGTMEKWGLDYNSLKDSFPRLICASITGYGSTGPYRDRPVFEGTLQAECGLTVSLVIDSKGAPYIVGGNLAQTAGAHCALIAILGALHQLTATGYGQKVEVNIYNILLTMFNALISNYVFNGIIYPASDNSPTSFVRTSTGWLRVSVGGQVNWKRFLKLVDDPLLHEPRFMDPSVRRENHDLLVEHIENWSKQYTTEEVIRIFTERGIPTGDVKSPADLSKDPHLLDRNQIVHIDVPGLGPIPFFATPFKLQDTAPDYYPAPQIGEHSRKVLADCADMSESAIDALENTGVVAQYNKQGV